MIIRNYTGGMKDVILFNTHFITATKIKDSLLTWFKTKKNAYQIQLNFFRNSVIFDNIFLSNCKTRKLNYNFEKKDKTWNFGKYKTLKEF